LKNIVIFGGTGQDGTLLGELFPHTQYVIWRLGRNGHFRNESWHEGPVNLADAKEVRGFLAHTQPDQVYYLAAHHHSSEQVGKSDPVDNLQQGFAVHCLGFQHVCRWLLENSRTTPVFYAASSLVFGHTIQTPQSETTPMLPTCEYGITKLAGIGLARLYRELGLKIAVGILYNHESHLRKNIFVTRKIVDAAIRCAGDPSARLNIGSLDAEVDWGSAREFVQAMKELVERGASDDFIISTNTTHQVRDFVRLAFATFGLDWQKFTVSENRPQSRPRNLRGDNSKLKATLGWAPSGDLLALVQDVISRLTADQTADVHA
jgi:GDPmannose 4,6-dehydratase